MVMPEHESATVLMQQLFLPLDETKVIIIAFVYWNYWLAVGASLYWM
jgi:hypothetical protein